jgi:2-iminobutanoate/2-iminopropanoate deaminase
MKHAKREVLTPDKAPEALGPYSLGIRTQSLVFVSGTIGKDPATGEFAPGGVAAETRQVLQNITHILESGGTSLDLVVKTTVFMQDLNEFATMNAVYAEFFGADPPARSTIQVSALPGGAAVEIEAVAVVSEPQVE